MKPQSPSFRLSGRDFQPLLSPQPLHPLVIHFPPFPTKHGRDPSVAVSPVVRGQLHHLSHQSSRIIGDMPFPSLGRSSLSQHLAGPTFGDALCSQSLPHPHHCASISACERDSFEPFYVPSVLLGFVALHESGLFHETSSFPPRHVDYHCYTVHHAPAGDFPGKFPAALHGAAPKPTKRSMDEELAAFERGGPGHDTTTRQTGKPTAAQKTKTEPTKAPKLRPAAKPAYTL